MQKVNINCLCLEITRRCNLECAHCLRGNSEFKDMSDEILNNIFSDISSIHVLDLGGGEPLLAPNVIEKIIKIINERKIKIDIVSFTTNGTVLSEKQINLLQQLKNIAVLDVRLSHDKFHLKEIIRKGLLDKFKRNILIFTKILGYSPLEKSFHIDNEGIRRIGRAKLLGQKDLYAINQWGYPTNYWINPLGSPNTMNVIEILDLEEDEIKVFGNLNFSVNGYLTNSDQEYSSEDLGPIFMLNVKDQSLISVLKQYELIYKESLGEDYLVYRDEIEKKHKI